MISDPLQMHSILSPYPEKGAEMQKDAQLAPGHPATISVGNQVVPRPRTQNGLWQTLLGRGLRLAWQIFISRSLPTSQILIKCPLAGALGIGGEQPSHGPFLRDLPACGKEGEQCSGFQLLLHHYHLSKYHYHSEPQFSLSVTQVFLR